MTTYHFDFHRENGFRVGREGEEIGAIRPKGFFVKDLHGELANESFALKLPAPWRGMRYRLEQDGRELASAARPKYARRVVTFDVELPGRKLELVSQDRQGLEWLLSEGGEERGRFQHKPFEKKDDWDADYHTSEESAGVAAFVAWLTREASVPGR